MYEILEKKQKTVEIDNEKELIVEYAVLVHPLVVKDGICFDHYGIRISTYSKENKLIDLAQIPNITLSTLEINQIFMLLLKHTVTPVSLYDVMDVYLADPDHFTCLSEELV